MIKYALFGACLALSGCAAQARPVCQPDHAIFPREGADLSFAIEVADDAAERAQGLMGRRVLQEGMGMLFIYSEPRPVSFWMKNTLIPLDMIFMDDTGVIRKIHENAIPLDETPIHGADPGDVDPNRLMILEIAGGEAARLGLGTGMAMAHPALDQKKARQPCR